MKRVYDNCCGIDVHKKLIVACFKQGSEQEVREFGATTRELLELCRWLKDGDCEMVAMESTASFWKPLYNILEASELDAIIVNARHMKNVPGRKTDVNDAEWIADLLQHGLLQASYIPDKDQRELRELVRYRKSLVGERTRELNRLQKMLEGANIKLSGTVSNINGKSARAILEHVLTGESFDDAKYDEMYAQEKIENLPDGMIGLSEMHDYGYRKDDVLPLTKEGAREWHRLGERIYPLFRDGTAGDYVSQEGIEQHDGIFGIRADAWDAILLEQREDYAEDEYRQF